LEENISCHVTQKVRDYGFAPGGNVGMLLGLSWTELTSMAPG